MVDPHVPPALVALIHDIGYKAKVIGPDTIETGISGYEVLVFNFSDSLQLFFGMAVPDHLALLEPINRFNAGYRFTRCYADDNSLNLEMDLFFDLDGSAAKATLEKAFHTFDAAIAQLDTDIIDGVDLEAEG